MTAAFYIVLALFVLGSLVWWCCLARGLYGLAQEKPVTAWRYLPWMSIRVSLYAIRRVVNYVLPFRRHRAPWGYSWRLRFWLPWSQPIPRPKLVTARNIRRKRKSGYGPGAFKRARIWPFVLAVLAMPVGCVLDLLTWPVQRHYRKKLTPWVVLDRLKRANGIHENAVINQANPGVGNLTLHAPRGMRVTP